MASSVTISVINTDWIEISEGVRYGFFTNHSDREVIYRSAITKPDATVTTGHRLHPGTNKSYVLSGLEKVWARSVNTLGPLVVLIVTPGYNTFTDSTDISRDFFNAVNRGDVEGATLIHKFGANANVGVTTEDIWEPGGILQWLIAAETMDVVSTDTINDISTGIGARTIIISGLDTDFNEIEETVTLLATPVTTINAFRRTQTIRVGDVGTYTGSNLGDISITASTSATIQGFILAGEGRSSQTQFTIPAGKTGYILRVSVTMNANKEVNINLHNRPGADIVTAPFRGNIHLHHWDGVAVPINEFFIANHVLEEKTDVWFDGEVTSTPNGIIDIDYDILLIDN